MSDYLPIGSVIKLRGTDRKLMITAYDVTVNDSPKSFDYGGCFYPIGMVTNEDMLVFNKFQIEEVLYKGYESEEQKEFIELLNRERKQ